MEKRKEKNPEIFICACNSVEHQIVVKYEHSKYCPILYASVHLKKHSVWGRIKYAIKYIFGYQCNIGAFEEFIFKPEDAERLQNMVDLLKNIDDNEQ